MYVFLKKHWAAALFLMLLFLPINSFFIYYAYSHLTYVDEDKGRRSRLNVPIESTTQDTHKLIDTGLVFRDS